MDVLQKIIQLSLTATLISWSVLFVAIGIFILKCLYNISPIHPLAKYPGPLAWRATRLCSSYHHSRGTLYQRIAAFHEQYGSTIRIAPDELSFTNPEAWAQIYNSRPQLAKSRYHFGNDDNSKRPESMITATDAEHMRLRRLTAPAFLNSGINEVEPVLQHYTDLLISQLTEASKEGSQNMVEWHLWTLNDVIGQLALGQEFECLAKRRMHPWPNFLLSVLKRGALVNQLKRFHFPMKLLGPFVPKEVKDALEGFVHQADEAVSKRLAREENLDDKESMLNRPDIVGLMLREMKGGDRLTEPEIVANSILIVGGGAETTSSCLSSTLYHLCKTPRVMKKLREELRGKFASLEEITIKETANMAYLKATVDEGLRIFPVASFITPRRAPEGGHVIDGELIPKDTYVSMGQWYMGRSEKFFDEPREFRPERWLDLKHEGSEDRAVDQTLRPFSLGPRNCIGKLLALAEARLVIAKMLWSFDVELDGPHDDWIDGARFYVLWELQPLNVKLTRAGNY